MLLNKSGNLIREMEKYSRRLNLTGWALSEGTKTYFKVAQTKTLWLKTQFSDQNMLSLTPCC